MKQATAKAKNGFVRYGVRVDFLPSPLDKLGIPIGAVIVAINATPTRNQAELERRIDETFELAAKYAKEQAEHEKRAAAEGKTPRQRRLTTFQEYIHKNKAQMMEIRLR